MAGLFLPARRQVLRPGRFRRAIGSLVSPPGYMNMPGLTDLPARQRIEISSARMAQRTGLAEIPILIVGAGPVGLALAADLGLRGVACLVIEQGEGPA